MIILSNLSKTHWFQLRYIFWKNETKRLLDFPLRWSTHGFVSGGKRWPFIKELSWKVSWIKLNFPFFSKKVDLNDVTKQNPSGLEELGNTLNYEVKLLQTKKKVTYNKLIRFKNEAVDFLAKICSNLIEKSPSFLILANVLYTFH